MSNHLKNLTHLIVEVSKMDEFSAMSTGEQVAMAFAKDSNTNEPTRAFATKALQQPVAFDWMKSNIETFFVNISPERL